MTFMSAKSLKIGASGGAAQAAEAMGGRIPYFPNIARKCDTYWDFGSSGGHNVNRIECDSHLHEQDPRSSVRTIDG